MTGCWGCPGRCESKPVPRDNAAPAGRRVVARSAHLARRSVLGAGLAASLGDGPAPTERTYMIASADGSIGFAVDYLGLFVSRGSFRRFAVRLTLDRKDPAQTRLVVAVDADSVRMVWREGAAMMRSSDFFDAGRYPAIRFTSTTVTPETAGTFEVRGVVTIRGVARPLVLRGRLRKLRPGTTRRPTTAEFVATGSLRRSDFGMQADQMIISDTVTLDVTVRVALPGLTPGG